MSKTIARGLASMKIISSQALRDLPVEIKLLVRDGVYSLYTVHHPVASFILVTSRNERYPLSSVGDVVSIPENDANNLRFDDAVAFSDLTPQGTLRVNFA